MLQTKDDLLKRILRQLLIYFVSIVIIVASVYLGISIGYSKYVKPVNANNTELVDIEIPNGSSLSTISQILYDNGLIRNKMVFKLYVDISNKASKLKAGRYQLSSNMELDEIMDELLTANAAIDTVKITLIEGWDIRKIAKYLVKEKEFQFTEQEFIEAAKIDNFEQFAFLKDIPSDRKAVDAGNAPLEGYLFPDTYIVYEDATPEDIMDKMLAQFQKVYDESIMEKAQELEMDMDTVVTLASVIQREARVSEEFAMISAVFHNRIQREMKLESCATVQFIIEEDRWKLTDEEMAIDSPYNTYVYAGLPAGPISSPGLLALKSAVKPFEEFMDSDNPYLYFVLKDPKTGEHSFNHNYQQHISDKELYEDKWDE